VWRFECTPKHFYVKSGKLFHIFLPRLSLGFLVFMRLLNTQLTFQEDDYFSFTRMNLIKSLFATMGELNP